MIFFLVKKNFSRINASYFIRVAFSHNSDSRNSDFNLIISFHFISK